MHRVLRAALGQAVRWRMLSRNPADAVRPPRPERREMKALPEKDMTALFESLAGTRLYAPVTVAATTGLRRGELLALRWSDVNLDAATLTVKRSLEETKAGLNFKSPKTREAQRLLDLLPLTVEVLRRHRIEQAKARLAAGPAWEDNDLVFPDSDGRPWRPSLLTGAFADRRTGIRFHDLRHSHATQLLRAGVHPKIVSERLGHAGVGITLDTYSHVLPGMQKQAMLQLEASLQAARRGHT